MKKYFMPTMTLALGIVLNLIGILAYSLQEGDRSVTALIPAFIGGIFLILGGMACSAKLRMHSVHGALVLALILGAYCIYSVVMMLLNLGDPASTVLKMFSFLTTGSVCIAYIALAIRSFRQARLARKEADQAVRAAEKAEAAAEV